MVIIKTNHHYLLATQHFTTAIEFKHQSKTGNDLEEDAMEGLKQIEEKSYTHNLKTEGYKLVHKYGIAFHKKSCAVVMG